MKKILTTLLLMTAPLIASCGSSPPKIANTAGNGPPPESGVQKPSPTAEEKPSASEPAKKPAPDELVKNLYDTTESGSGPFFQYEDRALVDRYFTIKTAELIWKDAIDSKGEAGALDFDPLYDAQDTEIKNFKIAPAVIKDGTGTVTVTFQNFDKMQAIRFLLLKENGEWKIDEIDYGDHTLKNLYKQTPER